MTTDIVHRAKFTPLRVYESQFPPFIFLHHQTRKRTRFFFYKLPLISSCYHCIFLTVAPNRTEDGWINLQVAARWSVRGGTCAHSHNQGLPRFTFCLPRFLSHSSSTLLARRRTKISVTVILLSLKIILHFLHHYWLFVFNLTVIILIVFLLLHIVVLWLLHFLGVHLRMLLC
jgi:hypothetical protein